MFLIWCEGCNTGIDAGKMLNHHKTCKPYLALQQKKAEADKKRAELLKQKKELSK